MLLYYTDTQNPESLPFCIQVRGDRQLTKKYTFNTSAVKTRQAKGTERDGEVLFYRVFTVGPSEQYVRGRAQEMAERGPLQEEGAEKTKTLRQKQAGVLGNRQEASGMELREEGLQEKRSGRKRQEAAQGGSWTRSPGNPEGQGGGAQGREHAQRRGQEAAVTGIHGCLMNRSRRLDSLALAVSSNTKESYSDDLPLVSVTTQHGQD